MLTSRVSGRSQRNRYLLSVSVLISRSVLPFLSVPISVSFFSLRCFRFCRSFSLHRSAVLPFFFILVPSSIGISVPARGGSARWNPVGSIIRRIPIVYRLVLHVYLIPRLVHTPQSASYVIYVPGFVLSPAYLPLSLYPTVSRCRASEKGRMQIATQLRGIKRRPGVFSISTAQWDFIASCTPTQVLSAQGLQ